MRLMMLSGEVLGLLSMLWAAHVEQQPGQLQHQHGLS